MSLDHVLLGALREPATGYDLKARFDEVFRHFWPAELSQIYRTLRRLEDDGLLTSRQESSDKGPERRVYRTTAKGRAQLRKWLAAGPEVRDDRHAFCAQTFFLDELADDAARATFLMAVRDEFASRLNELRAVESGWRSDDPRYPDQLPMEEMVQQFTLALGVEKYAAIVRWAESCLARLAAKTARSRATTLDAAAETAAVAAVAGPDGAG
jgi:DNA-binding PadR family transcriptional regulator